MKESDKILAVYGDYFLEFLEERRKAKIGELLSAYRQGQEHRDKVSELAVLAELTSAIKQKQQTNQQQRGKV